MTDNRSFEDRLLVALRKRGDMSIGMFMDIAGEHHGRPVNMTDEELVLACEEYAIEREADMKKKP